MKKSIYYLGVECGASEPTTFYWNGHEFIGTCKVKFPVSIIENEEKKAAEYLDSLNLIANSSWLQVA